jgi:spore coat protein A, manganese oxidase
MITRRDFLKLAMAGSVGFAASRLKVLPGYVLTQTGSLEASSIPKYMDPLIIPPAMPQTLVRGMPRNIDYYEIAVRQFSQHILPTGMGIPPTTVWSYGSATDPTSFNYPAFTIEARYNKPVRVKWINQLVDASGSYLPHILPVDPTLHWANPPGGAEGRDMRPMFESTPGPYLGPVPIVTHLHGGHTAQESDGYAEAWYLPLANNIPTEYAWVGSWYDFFKGEFARKYGLTWEPGSATFQYPNDQRASTLWYHDHTLGMTRLNVYAGPAGFYLLRRGPGDLPPAVLPGPTPSVGDNPFGVYYEIPLAVQDRSFNADGSLFYPDSRAFFDEFEGPYIPESDISPIWNPEFFGTTMVVNGRTWPYLQVEQRRYRFRVLNGCNSRFLILKFDNNLPFWQIGSDGGFLPAPVQVDQLLLGPAERADVVVDFSSVPVGTEIILMNLGPDEPFGGGIPGVDFEPADPQTTGQVMQLRVTGAPGKDTSKHPSRLKLPAFKPLGNPTSSRQVSLNEEESTYPGFDGPAAALLGTLDGSGSPVPMFWHDPITENPALNSIEEWEMYNFTMDAHPMHIHEVQFQVVNRQPIEGGPARPPESWETGFKDTVIAYPGEITRVKALFDLPGLFVWHCHIVEHEDNEMMRPYFIGPNPPMP